ncbi:MAG: ATP-binding protein [Acidimicrobiia bacterium]
MGTSSIETVFPPVPASVAAARRFLRAALGRSGADPILVDDALLALSELVTNAVVHANTEFRVRVTVDAGVVRVDVLDSGDGRPCPQPGGALDAGGRGLRIVDRVSDEWAIGEREDGSGVWFAMQPVRDGPRPEPG